MFANTMGVARKYGARAVSSLALVPVLVGNAYAALPADVKTETDAYKTDALAALGMVLAAGVAIWGLKKLGQKLGWI
ncbi:major capsid protein [Paracidovorax konjaci]|uniref:Bacteriophage coat protein B n=1 Tax=Paracidovorax konjaci TaxID=32040 RepID=A0A1I1VW83_9BURK|nr:major capsid protein [Paracidovorax konjaci]SFD87151.1 hypothetical protein SAMN04489710_107237 [Paracidovorax konjaci]